MARLCLVLAALVSLAGALVTPLAPALRAATPQLTRTADVAMIVRRALRREAFLSLDLKSRNRSEGACVPRRTSSRRAMTIGNSGRDLVIYLALLAPLEILQSSPRIHGRPINKQRGLTLAGGALLTVSAIKIGAEIMFKEASMYDMLGVAPGCLSSELKQGYKRESLKVHPDKLQAAKAAGEEVVDEDTASEAFVELKAAYDVLNDSQLRDLYDKFGAPGLQHKDDTTQLVAGLGFFYVVWLALAYLLTQRKSTSRAQTWGFSGLLALAVFEYQARILSFDFLQDALPDLTMFEKIELLHRLYPVYLLGGRMVAWLLFEDVDAHNFVMLQHLHWKTDRLTERLELLKGGGSLPKATIGAIAGGQVSPEAWGQFAQATNVAAQALPLGGAAGGAKGATAAEGEPAANPVPPLPSPIQTKPAAAKPAAGGGRSIGSLVWFFGVYFFFQWLLGRGS